MSPQRIRNIVLPLCAVLLAVGYVIVKYLWDLGGPSAKKEETVP